MSAHRQSVAARDAPSERVLSSGALVSGRYRVEAALGSGGAASVYRVRDQITGKKLALKRLTPGANDRLRALFEREFHMLAGLKHAHIVEVYAYGTEHTTPYYTMELLEGEDLSQRAPLPWREVCSCLHDVAMALGLLHARQVVYRDLNPRNIWRLADGRIKLIDFGALAAFGAAREIVGTPPFVAPEALYAAGLDQRTDLFALGALGYFLLTGSQAYPARSLRDLPSVWQRAVMPVSERVQQLARTDLPLVPSELDGLIAALLSQRIEDRPGSAAELIDRISSIAGFERAGEQVVQGSLHSAAFVGRSAERLRARRCLRLAQAGRGCTLLIEARTGEGRSRLLQELALDARLAGVTVVQVDGSRNQTGESLQNSLALQLFDALPEAAVRAATPFAATLGHLSNELRDRLGSGRLASLPPIPGEQRVRLQAALHSWLHALTREHPLLLLVDNLERLDEGSSGWLAGLSRELRAQRMLLIATLNLEATPTLSAGARALQRAARRARLKPLSADECLTLLHSMFGKVSHLRKLAERVHHASGGNPSHSLELVQQLVERQAISYSGGTWVLPPDIRDEWLVTSQGELLVLRLKLLPTRALALAQALAIGTGQLPLELCVALSDLSAIEARETLEMLVREGILSGGDAGYFFKHDLVRAQLHAQLSDERQKALQQRAGQALLATADLNTVGLLKAGLHLVKGGELARGTQIVVRAASRLARAEYENLAASTPVLEEALSLLGAAGYSDRELAPLLAALSTASFYFDHRLARYGERSINALEQLLCLPAARLLSRYVGRTLGLLLAFAWAAPMLALSSRKRRTPNFQQATVLLFNAVGSIAGVYATSLDLPGITRCERALSPFAVLGRDNGAAIMHELTSGFVLACQDCPAATSAHFQRLIARLDDPRPILNLTSYQRTSLLGGSLISLGAMQAQQDGPAALATADRLAELGLKMFALGAAQVRSLWYSQQGQQRLAAEQHEEAELCAIRLGTSWQIETWGAVAMTGVTLRNGDGLATKRAVEQLRWLSRDLPSLERYVERGHVVHLLLHRKFEEVVRTMCRQPRLKLNAPIGWVSTEGILARAYNELGQHEHAQKVCTNALSVLQPADLAYPALTLGPQIELARAEAGLGHHELAATRLDALIEEHSTGNGPLTMGLLHEARALVAYAAARAAGGSTEHAEKNLALYRVHLQQMERWMLPGAIPALTEKCESMHRVLNTLVEGQGTPSPMEAQADPGSTLDTLLSSHQPVDTATLQRALQVLASVSGASEAHLFAWRAGTSSHVASLSGATAPEQVTSWAHERMTFAHELDSDTVVEENISEADLEKSRDVRGFDGVNYQLAILYGGEGHEPALAGAILFASRHTLLLPERGLLDRLAQCLLGP